MSELKTLKDINFLVPGNFTERKLGNKYIKDELKQEAINWLKSYSPFLNDCNGAVDEWIKHFFNISDEDLK
jgi:hypothetical protein